MSTKLKDPALLLAEADQARDRQDWGEAAGGYASYLELRPQDAGIWIQRGNCLKEDGRLALALEAYTAAKNLAPDDADLQVQFGHLYKLQGRAAAAREAYERAARFDPSGPGFAEYIRMGGRFSALDEDRVYDPSAGAVFIDVSDVMKFLATQFNLTGIQRVVANVVGVLAAEPPGRQVVFCCFDAKGKILRRVSEIGLRRLFKLTSSPDAARDIVDGALEILESGPKLTPRENDVYLTIGAFWAAPDTTELIVRLRNDGVRTGVLVYDLLPITHASLVNAPSGAIFAQRLLTMLSLSDFVLTISSFVAREVVEFLKTTDVAARPVRAVPLAQEFERGDMSGVVRPAVARIAERPFVLTVGTLEARKNHVYLFRMWQELVRIYGEATPRLVCVGRWGWGSSQARDLLDQTKNVDQTVFVLEDVADSELAMLYDRCLCTMFPSIAEGWGLPVGESLSSGKICLASNLTSIPEVGGKDAIYIDPHEVADGVAKLRALIDDRAALDAANQRIAREFKPRVWRDVAHDLVANAWELGSAVGIQRDVYCALRAGEIAMLRMGAGEWRTASDLRATIFPLACVEGWTSDCGGGVVVRPEVSVLRFALTGGAPGPAVRVGLLLSCDRPDAVLYVRSGGVAARIVADTDGSVWHFVDARPRSDGAIELFLCTQAEETVEPAPVGFRLHAFAAVPENDLAARIGLMERLMAWRPISDSQHVA